MLFPPGVDLRTCSVIPLFQDQIAVLKMVRLFAVSGVGPLNMNQLQNEDAEENDHNGEANVCFLAHAGVQAVLRMHTSLDFGYVS